MIDLEKMAEQHKQLFPNATLESQVWKMEEDVKEFFEVQGTDNSIKELADCIIVCAGLYRWCPNFAKKTTDEIINANIDVFEDLEAEVNRKWQINLKRKWAWNGKTYHHVEN